MGIKHFLVKVKNIKFKDKGLKNLIKYLIDKKRHPNGIINFNQFDSETFFLNVCKSIEGNEKKKLLNGKGGRKIESYGDSYVFSFPPSLKDKLTEEKIKKITPKLINKLYNLFNQLSEENGNEKIDLKTFLKYIFVNIHTDQHTHINIVFSRIFQTKENIYLSNRVTNRKKFIELSKHIFDEIIEENFQLKKQLYNTKTNFKKGYKSIYIKDKMNELDKKITELKEEEERVEKKVLELEDFMEMKRSERKKEIEKIIKENEKREEIENNFQLVVRYYNSFTKKLQTNEMKGIRRDYNNITEKINKLEELTKNNQIRKITNEIKQKTNQYKTKLNF